MTQNAPQQRVSVVTLGVVDLTRARKFYADGNVWELAVNPAWDLAEDGSVTISDGSTAAS